ncbi:hypothetical protein [Streptomyces sp. NPDC005283]|uniref:hypothetical protein n=1 Tax=Streptomyces sp. NPDC005283 TaxID=3156871 RepID=UPI0034559027
MADRTRGAPRRNGENNAGPPSTCGTPPRKYRAVGAGHVLRTPVAQGWAPRPDEHSELPRETRPRRVPEPRATAAESAAASSGGPGQAPVTA